MKSTCTLVLLLSVMGFALSPVIAIAQIDFGALPADVATSATSTETIATATETAIVDRVRPENTTEPEELPKKQEILTLFEQRSVDVPGVLSFVAYWVQTAVQIGVPANTVFLILLTPLLATLVSFTRVVIGLPTLDMLVPIALAFAFVAVGVSVGLLILGAILLASYLSKIMLSSLRIMFYPKRSLSMFFLAIFVFGALTVGLGLDFERVLDLSIFPVLILMLLGDSIVSVQLHKSASETFVITTTTLALGLLGFVLASSVTVQNTLILYPEIVLLAIPINIMIGRYFGLRFFEVFRFNTLSD